MKDISKCSGFVVAGFETLAGLLDRFVNNPKYSDNFSIEQIQDFFINTSNRFLHSYGQNVSEKSYRTSHAKLVNKNLRICRETKFFDKGLFYVDSGGFQISVGLLDEKQTKALSESYYGFIERYSESFDRAFILDIVPGPGCKVLKSYDDAYNYNFKSYETAKKLPENIRDKIIYIHHFRTPILWKIFTELLNTDGMFDSFDHFATGGIVANMRSDIIIPCIIYILPLIPILYKAKKAGRKEVDFHILGGSNYRDILFYELVKKHVYNVHGIKLTVTYDSSGLWKGLQQGRVINIVDDNRCKKVDLREKWLDLSWCDNNPVFNEPYLSRKEKFLKEINEMASAFNFKKLTSKEIYDKETKTFYRDVNMYGILYILWAFSKIEKISKTSSDIAYNHYLDGNIEEFNKIIDETTKGFNQAKKTKKQKVKSNSFLKSLEVLTSLDIDYCEYIVKTVLSGDEFTYLTKDNIMKWGDIY